MLHIYFKAQIHSVSDALVSGKILLRVSMYFLSRGDSKGHQEASHLLGVFKLVYEFHLFHQVSTNCSDQVIEIVLFVIPSGQPERDVIHQGRVLAKRLARKTKTNKRREERQTG